MSFPASLLRSVLGTEISVRNEENRKYKYVGGSSSPQQKHKLKTDHLKP